MSDEPPECVQAMSDSEALVRREVSDGVAASELGPDLTACDREPIHIPGAIQPHGLLLVAKRRSLEVVGGAGDLERRLAPEWLGRSLPDLLGPAALELENRDEQRIPLGALDLAGGRLDGFALCQEDTWLVQLEPPALIEREASQLLAWLDEAGGAFERASDLLDLCDRAAKLFRELTGFDRVMVYRFLDDEAGVVVAEARAASLNGFMNHHFPASDIPKQARALYVRNRVRVIPDVLYEPAPLRPAEAALSTLDLSDVDLRSVSPIHLQYLRNMGVRASASVSIVKDGLLWGLIACHNLTPRNLSWGERLTCQVLAGGLARQVRGKEEAGDYRERLRLRAAEDAVIGKLGASANVADLAQVAGEDLCRMLGADGFAALQGGELQLVGRCPDREDVREIAAWCRSRSEAAPLHTASLSGLLPSAEVYRDLASGLLAVTVSAEEPMQLLWFRAEKLEVVNWAGNPHKAVNATPDATLTPRTSFAAWSEEVRGRSRSWSPLEVEAAHRLTRALFEARQNRRIRDLNTQLAATVADKDRLLVQKDYLVKEVNHRVQNSLQLVSAFLSMQSRTGADEVLTAHLEEAQRRISAVALVHRRLYSDDSFEFVDLSRYLEELVADLKTSLGPQWASQMTVELAPIMAPTDMAVSIGLLLTELVINANKYAYGGAAGPLSIALEPYRNRLRLIVADQGRGKTGTRKGFGSRMLDALVQQISGVLDESDNHPGLRMILTAPIPASTMDRSGAR